MIDQLERLLGPLRRRVRLMVGRAVVSLVDDTLKMQGIQVKLLADEVRGPVEHFQQYGVSSVPFEGAEGVYLSVGGDRDTGIVICVDDRRFRMKGLQAGEVALYTDLDAGADGQHVLLKRDGSIEAKGKVLLLQATEKVRAETPVLECTGDIKDHCDGAGKTMLEMRTIYDGHHHNETGTLTSTPNETM